MSAPLYIDPKKPVVFLNDSVVNLISASSATDLDVIQAMTVSVEGENTPDPEGKTVGRINYLMEYRHGSPFEHTRFTFFVKSPIFVFREFMRHRIASYNEQSGRYSIFEPEFYIPYEGRKLVNAGSSARPSFVDGDEELHALMSASQERAIQSAWDSYVEQVNAGITLEVARMILPVSTFSSMYVTMNARALMNFLSLRKDGGEESQYPTNPQREIEVVAEKMEAEFAKQMPITHAAFVKHGRVAP